MSPNRGHWLGSEARRFVDGRRGLSEGEDVVQRLHVEEVKTGARSTLDVAGVFPYLGLTPNTQFLNGLVPLNAPGQILTDLWMRTAVPGVLAAGDVRGDSARQLIAAAGDGATAALAAIRYLRTGQWRDGDAEAL